MAGRMRTVAALTVVAAATPLFVAAQWGGVRLGAMRPGRLPMLWRRMTARLLGLKIVVSGAMDRRRPLMIVANHVSWIDIVALGALGEMTFVARGDLGGWPVIGGLARLSNTIFVDRDNRRDSAAQAAEIAERLAAGEAVVLFAEGTTGDGVRLRPFKSSLLAAAEIAGRSVADVRIQPVAIAFTRCHGMAVGRRQRIRASWIGDEDLVPHVRDLLSRDVFDVEIAFGEAFAIDGVDRKQATRRIESDVRVALAAMRNGEMP